MEEIIKIIEWYNQEKNTITTMLSSEYSYKMNQYESYRKMTETLIDRVKEIDKILKEFVEKLSIKSK